MPAGFHFVGGLLFRCHVPQLLPSCPFLRPVVEFGRRKEVKSMNAYLFFVRAYPESEVRKFPYEFHHGVYIPACVTDTDSEAAECLLRAEITARGWIPEESQLLRTIEDPEAEAEIPSGGFRKQFRASDEIWLGLLRKCLRSPDSKLEMTAFRSLGENGSLVEPVDI